MGQDALTPSDYSIERQEQILRDQLNEGCRLARELHERVRSIPTGKLCMGSDQSEAAASSSSATQLRCSIAMATADVVAAFNKAVQLLLQSSFCTWDPSTALSAASSPLQTALQSSPQQKATNSCVPSVKAINLAAGQTKSPPLSPPGRHLTAPSALHRAAYCKQQSNMASASTSPSPSPGVIHSPLLSATSDMSDGSPIQPDLPADEATTANPMKAEICRKRKLQPKVALKMPAGNAETAESNTTPDDGHTWRKYGQKNILGSQYPRSYYRCTHKTDTGCPALKQVQRCDEDDSFFDVVYKGYHTCRSAELDKECWPLAFPQGLSSNFLHFPRSTSLIAPSFMLANMSAAKQSSAVGPPLTHHASLENLMPHQLCHVFSAPASSDALPLSCNADLSATHAFTANSAKLSAGLQPYQDNSGQALLDHLHPLFISNSSAGIQDGSSSKDQLSTIARGTATEGSGHVHGKDALSSGQYAQEQERALNPLGDWHEFENNNEEVYTKLAPYNQATAQYNNALDERRLPQPYGSLPFQAKPAYSCTNMAQVTLVASGQEPIQSPPSPNCSSLQEQDDAAANSALGFGSMDTADDLLGITYLDP